MCHRSVKTILQVEGMKCDGCVKRIENILENEKGIHSFNVSLEEQKIELLLKKNTSVDSISSKIEALGFKVTNL